MKNGARPLLIVASALLVLFTAFRLAKPWLWPRPRSEPDGHVSVEKNLTPPPRSTPTMEAFQQTMVRDVATSTFKEMFDLLRSATTKQRLDWLKQLDEMPAGPRRTVALSNFCKIFVQFDPHAAAESITTLTHDGSQAIAAAAMAGAVPQSAMGEMAAMLATLADDTFGSFAPDYLENVIQNWSAIDPLAVARFFEENPEVATHYAKELLSSWGQLDPETAKEWLENQPEPVQTEEAFRGLLEAWRSRDEAAALTFLADHGDDERLAWAIRDSTRMLFLRSPEEAQSFLLRLPENVRNTAISDFGALIGADAFSPPDKRHRKPDEIVNWIITLPTESWRKGLAPVLLDWNFHDSAGFHGWLGQLQPELRKTVLELFCRQESFQPLESAVPDLFAIPEPALRDQAIEMYVNQAFPESHDEAIHRISKSALSEAHKQYLIKLLPIGPRDLNIFDVEAHSQ